MSVPQANPELLAQLIDEWQERLRKGEKPELEEYARKYPDLADEISQLLPGLAALENLKGDALDHTIVPASGMPAAEGGPALEQLGDFRILREVGRGGMGVVYEAEQISLGRHVALKVLPQKVILDARQKRRFEREAKAAAKLHHTNIVPVFGVGEYDGMPYYVMQFIQGLGLDAVTDEVKRLQGVPKSGGSNPAIAPTVTRGDVSAADVARSLMTGNFRGGGGDNTSDQEPAPEPDPTATMPAPKAPSSGSTILSGSFSGSGSALHLPGMDGGHGRIKGKKQTYWQSIATIGSQVADALDYAHSQGILHRDIKPSNLLLDTRGIVWVTDFGLAKASDHQDDLTHTGDVLGTLRYMPPEAFEGRSDARGDIYALGLTLYEMLALQPAFGEKDRHRLVKQVTTLEPESLARLNRAIPRDLVTVIHKAIDRDPARRYQTAREFANDLDRFLANEPILARRSGAFERTLRWAHRRPTAAALLGVSAVAALALVASVIVLLYSQELSRAKGEAERARVDAEQARDAEFAQRKVTEAALLEAETQRGLAESARRDAEKDRELAVLSRGLLAVHTEQWPEAVKDLEGYTRSHADDLKAWLGLAKAHGRVGEPQKAINSYSKALALAAADNTESRIEAHIGRAEQEFGRGRLKEAIADYERAFQLKPDQPDQATAFARALYEDSAGWRVLQPVQVSAIGGVALKPQADGSIVPEGNAYNVESYTIVARTDLAGIRAFRLECLADNLQVRPRGAGPQVPNYQSGNFILSEFTVSAAGAGGEPRPVALNRAWSDYNYSPNYYYGNAMNSGRTTRHGWDASAAIDGDMQTGWSVLAQYGRSHTAVFLTAEPTGKNGETTLRIQLRFPTNVQMRQNSIGRLRLSVSTKEPIPASECLQNAPTIGGWVKLAAARYLRGEAAAAADALGRADKQSGDQSARQLVFSLVHDQPNEKTEALAAYDQAIARTKSTLYGSMAGDMTLHWLAAEVSTQWLKREPTNVRFRRGRAELLMALEQWTDAITDYDTLIAKDAGDYLLLLERGQCHARREKVEKATADFAAAAKLNPEDSLTWHRQKIQVLEYASDILTSLPHVEACVAIEKGKPGEVEFLIKRGRIYAQIARKDDANADFSRALELNPNSSEALLERGGAKAEQGNLDAAKADFVAARRLGSSTAISWHSQQLNKYEYGPSRNVELALLHIGELIELDVNPNSRVQYLLRRVYSLRQAKRWAEAIADYDRIIALYPRQANYFVERADCKIMAGQREKGAADLSEAMKLDRNVALQQILYKVSAAEMIRDWRLAEFYLDACLQGKEPSKGELDFLRRRAKVRAELGQYAGAIADCEQIFKVSPEDVEGGHALAAAYVTYPRELRFQGKTVEAKLAADRARAFLKARADARPNDERFGVELVNYLLTEAAGWQPLDIIDMKSAGGATIAKLPDASILVSGKNPDQDTYSITAKTNVGLNAIRLDVLPDASLPNRGPGRHPGGGFHLTDLAISAAAAATQNDLKPVRWRGAFATYFRPVDMETGPRDGPRGAIDGDPTTRWDIYPKMGLANTAFFSTRGPAGGNDASILKIQLEFLETKYRQATLGRFRLTGSPSRYALHAEQIIAYPTGGASQLAAAYALLGEREAAEPALRKAESIPANNDGGILLLNAWTADLLGFTDRATLARGLFLTWLSTKTTSDALPMPAIAIEVLSRVADDELNADSARRWLARAFDAMGDEDDALAALSRAISVKADDPGLYYSRGAIFMRQHKWKEAVADFQKMIDLTPDEHFHYLTTAPVFLLAGDEDGYRKFRAKILERFRTAEDPSIAERMAKASSLLKLSSAEAKIVLEMSQRALASTKYPGFRHWYHLCNALTCYRSDNFGSAIEHARLSREQDSTPKTATVQIATRLVEALAQHFLGKTTEARALLAEAEEMIHSDLIGLEKVSIDGSFHDWVLCKLLQHEAELAIKPAAPPGERAPMPREVATDATNVKQ